MSDKQTYTGLNSFSEYSKLRLERHFTDSVIQVEDVEFEIHKIILCNCSPYFRWASYQMYLKKMMHNNLYKCDYKWVYCCHCKYDSIFILIHRALFTRWTSPYTKVVQICGLSPDMMHLIIEFAYTGTVCVTEDNAQELLLAAEYLDVMGIKDTCCIFLEEQLCPDNCIGIWQFSDICCPQLRQTAYEFILDNFGQVVLSDELHHLSGQELSDILDRDSLNVSEERTAYEAVYRWMAYPPEEKKEYLVILMSKVH